MSNPNEIWKSVIEADVSNFNNAGSNQRKGAIPDGVYPAHITSVETKTFRSLSKGVEVTFALDVEGDLANREIKTCCVLVNSKGAPNPFGSKSLKRLMLQCGLTSDQILKFKYPEVDKKQLGGFKDLLEKELTIVIKGEEARDGEFKGKVFARVVDFSSRTAA